MSEIPVHLRPRRLADWINPTNARKVHSLVDKVYQRKNLEIAWDKVKANRGSGGVDGQSLEAFTADLDQRVRGERRRDSRREGVAIDRERAAGRDLVRVTAAHDQGIQPPHLLVQQPDRVVLAVVGAVLSVFHGGTQSARAHSGSGSSGSVRMPSRAKAAAATFANSGAAVAPPVWM